MYLTFKVSKIAFYSVIAKTKSGWSDDNKHRYGGVHP